MPQKHDPLHGDDYVFDSPPSWLPQPFRRVAGDLIYDEAHAMELGFITGLVFGIGLAAGYTDVVIPLLVLSVASAFGLKKAPGTLPVAQRVERAEPWYFGVLLAVGLAVGVGAFLAVTLLA